MAGKFVVTKGKDGQDYFVLKAGNGEVILQSEGYKMRRWYFGHHHRLKRWKYAGSKFYCCGLHGEYWSRESI